MKARLTGIALIAVMVITGWSLLTFGQAAPQAAPAQGGQGAAAGGGGGRGGGGGGGGRGGGGGGRGGGAAANTQPAPRWPDGRVMLDPGPGDQKGLWHGAFSIAATN